MYLIHYLIQCFLKLNNYPLNTCFVYCCHKFILVLSRLRRGAAVSVITSGSEIREFEPHSGSHEVTQFPLSVYHHYVDSYDGGSYQSIGLTA